MIYLASPYSDADPAVEQARFDAVCRAAAALMRQGLLVFSPIAHSHPIARFGLPRDWAFWQRYDIAFLAQCDELWVLMLAGWESSVGVRAEIDIAREMGKPVRLVDPVELTTENTPAVTGASHAGAVAAGSPPQGELAAFGLHEPAGVALGLDLTQNGCIDYTCTIHQHINSTKLIYCFPDTFHHVCVFTDIAFYRQVLNIFFLNFFLSFDKPIFFYINSYYIAAVSRKY